MTTEKDEKEQTPGPEDAGKTEAPMSAVKGLLEMFGNQYQAVKVDAEPSIPSYDLPLSTDEIGNYEYFMNRVKVDDDFKQLLMKNGFACANWAGDDFVKAYERFREMEVPVYVTSDSVLHLYHIQFDETLKHVEQKDFIPRLEKLTASIISYLKTEREDIEGKSEDLRDGLDKALAFIVTGHELLTEASEEIKELEKFRDSMKKQNAPFWPLAEVRSESLRNSLAKALGQEGKAEINIERINARISELKKKSEPVDLPSGIREWVDHDKSAAMKHEGFVKSPIFQYKEDFSQYVPRGHYTRGFELKRYFRAMMWFGRMTFLIKGGSPSGPTEKFLISKQEALRQTIAAAYLTRFLENENLNGETAKESWERIYSVTAFFVGLADDLGFPEYENAFTKALGSKFSPEDILEQNNFLNVQKQIAMMKKPAIYSGTGESGTVNLSALKGTPSPEELNKALNKTQGFRFMGQRFVPDSYAMSELVFPTVNDYTGELPPEEVFTCEQGKRMFPRGLEVMALLGSDRAKIHLGNFGDSAYLGYDESFSKLESQFNSIPEPEGWNINLYWSWLYTLKSMLRSYQQGYQTYMTTNAWVDKQLNASLGSWSQLRHDTILYVKQSYTMLAASAMPREPKDYPGYVEPVPEFYARLLALSRLTRTVLSDMDVLDADTKQRLKRTEQLFSRLLDIAEKELRNEELSEKDHEWIKHFSEALEQATAGHEAEAMKTTLIADVHTDQNTGKVLEEGTGYIGLIVVANRLADGSIGLAAGPVFTYYEFKHPMSDRLTDEAWRKMLGKVAACLPEKKPEFIRSYFVK